MTTPATAATPRKTAEERREAILGAARVAFADGGLHGTSTDDIARRAGISQPYLFRLFRTKKELFMAACARCMEETSEAMAAAAHGLRGEEALQAMGTAYMQLLEADPRRLRLQMHMYAACDDAEVRAVARSGFGELHALVERTSGASRARVSRFFAKGMLLNVLASMDVRESNLGWAQRLLEGCREDA
jgi:AcrR family transcriptional regulator